MEFLQYASPPALNVKEADLNKMKGSFTGAISNKAGSFEVGA